MKKCSDISAVYEFHNFCHDFHAIWLLFCERDKCRFCSPWSLRGLRAKLFFRTEATKTQGTTEVFFEEVNHF